MPFHNRFTSEKVHIAICDLNACGFPLSCAHGRFVAGRGETPDGVQAYRNIGTSGQFHSGVTVQVIACRPKSRGHVQLQSSGMSVCQTFWHALCSLFEATRSVLTVTSHWQDPALQLFMHRLAWRSV